MGATSLKDRPRDGVTAGYERDFHAWALDQATALRAGRYGDLDAKNLAEEIECLGKEQFNRLESHFRIILIHLLKWDHQPDFRSRSWMTSIRDHRLDLDDVLADNPSLRPRIPQAIDRAFRRARLKAADETGLKLSIFPVECPYFLDDITTRPIAWPDD